jgi:hypothetical protein
VHKINNLQCPFFPLLWREPDMAAYAHRMVQAAGQDGLGEQVRVTQFSCEVIGILAAKGQGGMGDQDDIVLLLLPLHTLQRRVTGGRKVSMRAVSMENGNNARRLKASACASCCASGAGWATATRTPSMSGSMCSPCCSPCLSGRCRLFSGAPGGANGSDRGAAPRIDCASEQHWQGNNDEDVDSAAPHNRLSRHARVGSKVLLLGLNGCLPGSRHHLPRIVLRTSISICRPGGPVTASAFSAFAVCRRYAVRAAALVRETARRYLNGVAGRGLTHPSVARLPEVHVDNVGLSGWLLRRLGLRRRSVGTGRFVEPRFERGDPAPLPAGLPNWQVKLSHLTEWSLYASMLVMPILGILGASFSKKGISFFGTALASWAVPNHDTAEKFFGLHSLHSLVAWVLVALIALHVLGGLKHLLIDKELAQFIFMACTSFSSRRYISVANKARPWRSVTAVA